MDLIVMTRRLKRLWMELTDPNLVRLVEKRRALIEKIEDRYGVAPHEAEHQVDAWMAAVALVRPPHADPAEW